MKKNHSISGLSLPISIIFTIAGMGLVFSYYDNLFNEYWLIEYQIAETKAGFMADTGIAESRKHMIHKNFNTFCDAQSGPTFSDTTGYINQMNITGDKMGEYYVQYCMDPESFAPRADSYGRATVKNVYGKSIEIEKIKTITFSAGEALNDYLYLTNSEKAGGAPFVFDGNTPTEFNRREVNFGTGDAFNSQWPQDEPVCEVGFQTNGEFVMSDFGCPTFYTTVTVTKNDDGEINTPDMGFCNESQVFQGSPPLDTLETICLSSNNDFADKREYIENINGGQTGYNQHLFLDATSKMKHTGNYIHRDTLIMTDIEFITDNGGGVRVKQWWYLKPPYLNQTANLGSGNESPFALPNNMDCNGVTNLYQCDEYIESMEDFHAKTVLSNGTDNFLHDVVQSTFGFHHYDVKRLYENNGTSWDDAGWESQMVDSHLLPEYVLEGGYKTYYFNKPTAIYVKGGPVRVHGTFKGRYTVMTDENIAYHRHAWGQNLQALAGGPRIDTLWTNIWITDDLKNADSGWGGSLLSAQPDESCDGASENILGLVSGANVYVANTLRNGARNNWQFQDVNIHAHIIAFNESFAAHYWQNTTTTVCDFTPNPDIRCSEPPYGDNQASDIHGATTGGNDYRGNIYLWGGVVQKYRGYMKRNDPGPYPTGPIGYDKVYNFDCNLKCTDPPPLYPDKRSGSCDEESIERSFTVANYY